jgi:hypothetical protein
MDQAAAANRWRGKDRWCQRIVTVTRTVSPAPSRVNVASPT